jgi:hypothetical protein
VTPFGDLIAVPERGTFMGNRGILHDHEGRIKRAWQVKRWLVCVLEFRGRKRTVMTPNRYTELFFLDEATALAAGHRPCAECQHARYIAFRDTWAKGRGDVQLTRPGADEMDNVLHAERVGPTRSKEFFVSPLDELPDGVLIVRPDVSDQAWLVLKDHLRRWTPAGYGEHTSRPRNTEVKVLTPRSTVAAIRAGYTPEIHPSAGAGE